MQEAWSFFAVAEGGTVLRWPGELAALTGRRPRDVEGAPCYRCVEFWDAASGEEVCTPDCPLLCASGRGKAAFMDRLVRVPGGAPAHLVAMALPAADGEPGVVAHLLRPLSGLADLTPAELRVLALVRQGRRTEEVASMLGVRVSTVRTHIRRVLDKIGAGSRVEALASIAWPAEGSE